MWHFHCIRLSPFLFRLVNLSEGNCLIWRLLRISDSGSELHVSVQPSDTLSHCEWKFCEMCVSQKHIPHKSPRSISRDTCSDESWSQWERVCLHRIALSERLCPVLSELAGYSVQHWKKLLMLAGQLSIVLAVRRSQCVPGQMPSVIHYTSSTETTGGQVETGHRFIFLSQWAAGWEDSRHTEL